MEGSRACLPVLLMYDGVDEWVVNGRCFRYNSWDSFGVRRQDVGMPGLEQTAIINVIKPSTDVSYRHTHTHTHIHKHKHTHCKMLCVVM